MSKKACNGTFAYNEDSVHFQMSSWPDRRDKFRVIMITISQIDSHLLKCSKGLCVKSLAYVIASKVFPADHLMRSFFLWAMESYVGMEKYKRLQLTCRRPMMEECIARVEVYRLLLMSPLMRKISACAATTSARRRSRISLTPNPKRPQVTSCSNGQSGEDMGDIERMCGASKVLPAVNEN